MAAQQNLNSRRCRCTRVSDHFVLLSANLRCRCGRSSFTVLFTVFGGLEQWLVVVLNFRESVKCQS